MPECLIGCNTQAPKKLLTKAELRTIEAASEHDLFLVADPPEK